MLESDLADVTQLFLADGDGLPLGEITEVLQPISDILSLMQLSTEALISTLKQVGLKDLHTNMLSGGRCLVPY